MLQPATKKRLHGNGRNGYATHSDFCAIFIQHMQSLYLLALLMTGDEVRAEQCFLAAFELCEEGSSIFKESAVAWSRRSVIKSAIRFIFPAPDSPSYLYPVGNLRDLSIDQVTSLKCVQDLPPFDRFVFVMSVLERYSDRECSLLLDCAIGDILPARIRAFQQMSQLEKSYPVHSGEAQPYVVDPDWLECG